MVEPESAGRREDVLERAHDEYVRRQRRLETDESLRDSNVRIRERTARHYARMLDRAGLLPLGARRVIDVGCGDGEFLIRCRRDWGHSGEGLAGIDLMEDRIEALAGAMPELDLRTGSADALPWPDASFDLAHQSMLLSSVLDEALREAIAGEMRRVVRPGGWVLWYDFIWNPLNRATVGMPKRRIRACFPGWSTVQRKRISLAPPLARPLLRVSGRLVGALEACKVFNLWHLALLQKPL
ncbi:MAG: class I SAM-dependent methyltransferase [Phycisphaerae bacterium]